MTLLENMCKVNGQQGGTIHQFLSGDVRQVAAMQKAHADYTRIGITFPSRKAIEKLAAQYHVEVTW